jgi:hypothetical protein
MLSMGTSDLDMILVSDCLEIFFLHAKLGQLDVNRGSQCGSKVSWARSDVTQSFIEGELNHLLDVFAGSAKSVKDCLDVSAWLHGNYSQLILFVDPDQESLVIVVENASAVRPVSIKADCF